MDSSDTQSPGPLYRLLQEIRRERRTGTLRVSRGETWARLGFVDGEPVSASSAGLPRLSQLLVEAGLVDPITVREAARIQAEEQSRRTLAQILVGNGVISAARLVGVVAPELRRLLADLLAWESPELTFDSGQLDPPGSTALDLTGLIGLPPPLPESKDDAGGGRPAAEASPSEETRGAPETGAGEEPDAASGSTASSATAGFGATEETGDWTRGTADHVAKSANDSTFGSLNLPACQLQVLSPDPTLAERLSRALPASIAETVRSSQQEAGRWNAGHPPPILMVDLRPGALEPERIGQLRRQRPQVPVIALVDPGEMILQAYRAGAVAAVPPNPQAMAACIESVAAVLRTALMPDEERPRKPMISAGQRSLAAEAGATVALELMQAISNRLERAILFFPQQDALVAAGAFGDGTDLYPLAELTRGLRIPLASAGPLARALDDGQGRSLEFSPATLPPRLLALLGPPASGRMMILPVPGALGIIAVLYGDNGAMEDVPGEIEGIEAIAAEIGLALENELLRSKVARLR